MVKKIKICVMMIFIMPGFLYSQKLKFLHPYPTGITVNVVEAIDSLKAYFGGDRTILYTPDGGINWEYQWDGNSTIYSIDFPLKDAIGYAVGTNGLILKTMDGHNWDTLYSGVSSTLNCVFFINHQKGWVCGSTGTILKTEDGGNTWNNLSFGNYNFTNIWFCDPDTGYLITQNARVFKTTNGGLIWDSIASLSTPYLQAICFPENARIGYAVGTDLIAKTQDGGYNWVNLAPTQNVFYDVCFIKNDTGYVAGWYGKLIKTIDGGQTWQNMSFPYPSSTWWYSVDFLNSKIGFASGDYGRMMKTLDGQNWIGLTTVVTTVTLYRVKFINENVGYTCGWARSVYKTTNGGRNWQSLPLPPGEGQFFAGMDFLNENVGYVAGQCNLSTGTYNAYKTVNGQTWFPVNISNAAYTNFYSIEAVNDTLCFMGGINAILGAIIYKSTDGLNFSPVIYGFSAHVVRDIQFLNERLGFAVGGYLDEESFFLKTTDGGNTWNLYSTGTNYVLYSVYFVNKDIGFAVGGYLSNGVILKTTNGGLTWTPLNPPVQREWTGVYFIDSLRGYVTSYTWSNSILKTEDGGQTWELLYFPGSNALTDIEGRGDTLYICGYHGWVLKGEPEPVGINEKFSLEKPNFILPNLIKGTIKISPFDSKVKKIYLYDITGKRILEISSTSNHILNLKSGIYFIKIKKTEKETIQKFILLK